MLVAAADGFGLTESNGKPWRWDNVVGLHAQDCRALVDDPVFLSASAGPGVVGRRSTDPCSPAIGASSGAVPGSRNGSQATRHWLSRGRARNGRHRHRGGVRLSVDRRRRASGGRRDGLAPVRAVALGWPSRGFVRRSTGVAIRSCLSEPVTPSGQASLSHRAGPLAGLPPRGGFADRPGGWPLHDGPAVRHRPHGRVAVTTRSPDHRRRHSKKAVNPGRLRRGNIDDGAFARSGQGGVDHGGGAGSDRLMPLGGAP
jgi:hypothetical protein